MLAYGPLAHGLLTGKMTDATTFPPDDWRAASEFFTVLALVSGGAVALDPGDRPEPTFLIAKPFQPATVSAVISQALFFDRKARLTPRRASA